MKYKLRQIALLLLLPGLLALKGCVGIYYSDGETTFGFVSYIGAGLVVLLALLGYLRRRNR